MKPINALLRGSKKGHKWLGWTAGSALFIFALSGMMHPLMTWTGPRAAAFFPPQAVMQAEYIAAIPNILQQNGITKAIMVKVVPAKQDVVLQVTEHNDTPRRYFDLTSGNELIDYDQQHAIWLARYYTGLKQTQIKEAVLQAQFNTAYPWVNRLLPVYRIRFDTEDRRTAFIYTELGVLANLSNDWKTSVQSIFRMLHTWSWLDNFEHARVFLMMLLLLSLLGMAITGTAMVLLMKNRKMEKRRKIHRLISYAIWVPLLLFSASGIYHLLQYAYGNNHRGLQLGNPITVTTDRFGSDLDWLQSHQHRKLNGISVVEGPEGDLLYRLSIPHRKPGQKMTHVQRLAGVPDEKATLYFQAKTGRASAITDRDMAIHYAGKQLGLDKEKITRTMQITRFGTHYDFRNKRLPVWRIDYESELGDMLFIDPATGILVDRLVDIERYEGYSFSFLHKWNFLVPFIGRMPRDILIVAILSFATIAALLGYMMLIRPSDKKAIKNLTMYQHKNNR